MKKQYIILFVFLQLIINQIMAQQSVSVALLGGLSPPKKGLEFNAGAGIRAAIHLNRVYVGAAAIFHQGGELSIRYGSAPGVGISDGRQYYEWNPKFYVTEAGYDFKIVSGPIPVKLTPFASAGLANIPMKSHGVYGTPDDVKLRKLCLGWGVTWSFTVKHITAGIEYRQYPLGDAEFEYGKSAGYIPHGFSTHAYYDAFFSVIAYKF
jgi:hypothetical protein